MLEVRVSTNAPYSMSMSVLERFNAQLWWLFLRFSTTNLSTGKRSVKRDHSRLECWHSILLRVFQRGQGQETFSRAAREWWFNWWKWAHDVPTAVSKFTSWTRARSASNEKKTPSLEHRFFPFWLLPVDTPFSLICPRQLTGYLYSSRVVKFAQNRVNLNI